MFEFYFVLCFLENASLVELKSESTRRQFKKYSYKLKTLKNYFVDEKKIQFWFLIKYKIISGVDVGLLVVGVTGECTLGSNKNS